MCIVTPLSRKTPLRADPEKVKSWLNRRKPIPRKQGIARGTARLRAIGRRAKRMRTAGGVDGELCRRARESPCVVSGRVPTIERPNHPHHVDGPRLDLLDGEGNVVPLAPEIHRDWHDLSERGWRRKHGTAKPTRAWLREQARRFADT